MPAFYLNTYTPLIASKAGRDACAAYQLPPLIDGSIRREPDLEHDYPAISCLCRAGKFAPRLQVDDTVVYLTTKRRYQSDTAHWRLTAVLQVHEVLPSHRAAARWYRERGLALPNNCLVPGNRANPLEKSHRLFRAGGCAGDRQTHRAWDAEYRSRAKEYPTFVVCQKHYCDLTWDAPVVTEKLLVRALGSKPGTQNPGKRTMREFHKLMRALRIDVPLAEE